MFVVSIQPYEVEPALGVKSVRLLRPMVELVLSQAPICDHPGKIYPIRKH